MSNFIQKPNYGALFSNQKKENDTQPGFTGEIMLPDGKLMRIAAWAKTSAGGKSYFSLKLSEITATAKPAPPVDTGPHPDDVDEELGF